MQWSPYDAAVPHTRGLAPARDRFADLRARRRTADDGDVDDVRDVVVVTSSSRGGSTHLGTLLRQVPGLLHLRAEVNPLFVVAGLHEEGDPVQVLREELVLDTGMLAADASVTPTFAWDVAWRLVAQWPEEDFDLEQLAGWVLEAGPPSGEEDVQPFHIRLLQLVRTAHPRVDPWYYDLPDAVVERAFPGAAKPEGPPGGNLVEMPPFVLVPAWRRATAAELANLPLVLTTPRNSWRLAFLRQLFPAARFRVVHLVRNPAAAINGLIDGWLHRGFFNCRVDGELAIGGYSDRRPGWGRIWWNFDFPPEWETVRGASLTEVCALQWRSAHEATLEFLAGDTDIESHRVRAADLAASAPGRRATFEALAEWLGVAAVRTLAEVRVPPVMATAPPRPARWRAREAELDPVLRDPALLEMARRLGYDDDRSRWM